MDFSKFNKGDLKYYLNKIIPNEVNNSTKKELIDILEKHHSNLFINYLMNHGGQITNETDLGWFIKDKFGSEHFYKK
jgi:hypothetical protein